MCYYSAQKVTHDAFLRLLAFSKDVTLFDFLDKGVISGFSDEPIAVIVPTADKANFDVVQMEWGFIPKYIINREQVQKFRTGYKDAKGKWHTGYTTQNAKAENLLLNERGDRPSIYQEAAMQRRCLVLSTGFFEWRHFYRHHKVTGLPLKTPDKYPYFVNVKDAPYFFMAAVWQPWTDQDTGEHVNTVSVVTTEANSLMAQVHNANLRMPTILDDELAWRWMTADLSPDEIEQIARTQYPSAKMEAYTITKDFQALLDPTEPFAYADLPALELVV